MFQVSFIYFSKKTDFTDWLDSFTFWLSSLYIGVYFTKYAKNIAETLDVKGWIRVNQRGTVYGQIQGEKDKVDEMYVMQ